MPFQVTAKAIWNQWKEKAVYRNAFESRQKTLGNSILMIEK